MTNQDTLSLWIYDRWKNWAFKTSDLKEYAYKYPTNRTDRDKRILREKGYLERLESDGEKERFGYFGKEDMYSLTDEGKKKARSFGQMNLFAG